MSLDIQKIIDESYQSHTKETEEQDIGFLSVEQTIIYPAIIFQYIGKSNHECHDYQKNTSSHSRSPLFMFVHLGEDSGFFSGDCRFTDSLSYLIFSQDRDIDRVDDP